MDKAPTERDAEAFSSKASRAEFARNYDQAFRLYIKTAEAFVHLSRSSIASDKTKLQWKTNASRALERAEKIKRFVEVRTPTSATDTHGEPATPELNLTPVGINHFSPQEQFYVLKKGGVVNGLTFPLWEDPTSPKSNPGETFLDPDGQPKLSPEQEKVSTIWRRLPADDSTATSNDQSILPQQILQHVVTDCSVCASVSVCLEHRRRFGPSMDLLVLRPSTVKGQYYFRAFINGAWRRVIIAPFAQTVSGLTRIYAPVIDDLLPLHPTEHTLMCMSVVPMSPDASRATAALWPTLVEKAYMKLMGGYDFPGSNSSIDLRTLTGWIPEQIDFKGATFERERTWERVQTGFENGFCLITLGTGPNPDAAWRHVPLLPSHSYAVIDVFEAEEGRMFTVLDSWVAPGEEHQRSRELLIPWADVLNTFAGLYLSWDPRMWPKALMFHSMWKRNAGDNEGVRHAQIQFSCDDGASASQDIWILLSRHLSDTQRTEDFISIRVDLEDNETLGTMVADSQRILSPKSTYTNSTHVLTRMRIPASQKSGVLCVSASYDGDMREVGFTLCAYAKSGVQMSWVENTPEPPYTKQMQGTLTSKTGGGNSTYPTFMVNPQYEMIIRAPPARTSNSSNKASLTLNVQSKKDVPVNVAAVWSQGTRVTELCEKDLVATSGAYSYGLARLTKSVLPGRYVIIVSAFEPKYTGPFTLDVNCSYPFDIKPIPQEGAGMYCKQVGGAWEGNSAAGAPTFDKYTNNPIFELHVASTSQIKIRLSVINYSSPTSLNVTVYRNINNSISASIQQQHVATSGPYDDPIAGVATPQITLGAGKYYIIPSTFNPGTECGFRMLVYCSTSTTKVIPLGTTSD